MINNLTLLFHFILDTIEFDVEFVEFLFCRYIYGLGVVGSLGMYTLLNMMSLTGVTVTCVISVLGYCMLPMVILSTAAILTVLT